MTKYDCWVMRASKNFLNDYGHYSAQPYVFRDYDHVAGTLERTKRRLGVTTIPDIRVLRATLTVEDE